MPKLGLKAPRKEIDALFDEFDPDGSGEIEYKEFNKLLRRGKGDVKISEMNYAGKAGKIELKAKNKSSRVASGGPEEPPTPVRRKSAGGLRAGRRHAGGRAPEVEERQGTCPVRVNTRLVPRRGECARHK